MTVQITGRAAPFVIAALALSVTAFPAVAYVGPGAGLTLLGALWALILAVVMSVGFVLLWPFRRYLRRGKQTGAAPGAAQDDGSALDRGEER